MHLLGPSLLLLEYLAFSGSVPWEFDHPNTLYTWEGACVWIPCTYRMPKSGKYLNGLILYHGYKYDEVSKEYRGTVLYNKTNTEEAPKDRRVEFLGDNRSNCTFRIDPVKVKDSGQLGLRMISGSDKWMEEIGLNVSETAPPPRIQLPPEIQELEEVTLTCSLNFACFGYQLQWSLKGPVVSSTSLTPKTVSMESKLTYQPQWTDHGKNLTCQLLDPDQRVLSEETVRLDVKHPPKLKIEVSPKEATVTKGEEVTMTCQIISSNPEYRHISWLKDGISLRPEEMWGAQEKLKLTLSTVTKEMSGKYQCEARNDIGSGKSEEVDLQVLYAPEPSRVQILPSPAKEGNSVVLTCTSLANPPPTNYTWYHNEMEVPGRTNKTFHIPEVLLGHAGTYSCFAENRLGPGQVGQEAELDVQYPPKEVITVIQNPGPIREGDEVTLSCIYNSSNPGVTEYIWNPQGTPQKSSSRLLKIPKVAWDTKPITCSACNTWCSQGLPVNLDVQYAPKDVKVLLISPGSEICSGDKVHLQCHFSSSRPTDVHFFWKKNGILLQEGRELRFDAISPEDAGSYNCLVNNSVGQSTSEAWMLQVLYAPRRLRVSVSPADGVTEGKKVVLTCQSDANPPVYEYSWFDWNNQSLHRYDQMLRLDPVKVQHSGTYRCRGTNRLGVGTSPPSTLTVYYSPETISRRAALGVGFCLAILLLVIWGVKFQRSWKRIRSRQELQENSSGQSFFVRNKKIRRAPLSEGPHSLGCYNPVMEDAISYAALRFPVGETDTQRTGDTEPSETQGLSLNMDDTVTYSVVQRRHVVRWQGCGRREMRGLASAVSPGREGLGRTQQWQRLRGRAGCSGQGVVRAGQAPPHLRP
ncbi:B-cell receptor CD22 isoform X1 [Equus caballus]|uniref:B-cell receptor CD22 isoform X1 n=1 Tax=Equus caballus TaxID=9796 RepID=UPI0003ACAE59|nr:PREDICTED: B-cell receptor CD22 isoform X1 [Equus przewalskii]